MASWSSYDSESQPLSKLSFTGGTISRNVTISLFVVRPRGFTGNVAIGAGSLSKAVCGT
ncbi:hypothetical protein CONPUDRAFT_148150 [Coniophora puteana RWD-64-598 SS2]|uniref:Uncharacterized protein n=1 Tax=Coniophora puteana (strain RWD-64-598) TaxID=741705 RepID=A0A5M3N3U5_CONPW|nr:uncharacterized protein CONPUDRAFT_148150 [Coniophora puteana RWD-64-598 SS2]EIW86026.1 hypothetical protein CONPUDRAFT_148150 [Coniophora puteana RWD-64-598 SS2]